MAGGTGTEVTVERKVLRCQFREEKSGLGVGVVKGKIVEFVFVLSRNLDESADAVFTELLSEL